MNLHYAVSDIHGCYGQYLELLDRIRFCESDTLFVLGDCVDRGPEPIKLLLDMMNRPNVFPITGNHDLLARYILGQFSTEITESSIERVLNEELFSLLADWLADGGEPTWSEFKKLSVERRGDVLDYLENDFSTFEEITVKGNTYLMLHGGLEPFDRQKTPEQYDIGTILFSRPDYNTPYYPDKFTITGHTPTINEPGNDGRIIRRNNHIAIDCGCVFGGRLAAFCLDTGEEFYVDGIGK